MDKMEAYREYSLLCGNINKSACRTIHLCTGDMVSMSVVFLTL